MDPRSLRIRNEVVNFLREQRHCTPDSDATSFGEDICSLVCEACSRLGSSNQRLTLLDRLIRRKSDLFLPFVTTSNAVVELLVSDFCGLASDLQLGKLSVLTDLCTCAQLLSFCISKSTANMEIVLRRLFIPLKSMLQMSVSIDCLTTCSILLVSIMTSQDAPLCTELFFSYFRDSLCRDRYSNLPYFELIKDLLMESGRKVVQLALIHAFLGISSAIWSADIDGETSLAVLVLNFCFPRGLHARAYGTLEMPILLFLAKIGQIWSARYKDCGTTHVQETVELFNFSLELKGSPLPVIRHACLDICTNLLIMHFKCCKMCTASGDPAPCDELQKLLCSIADFNWHSQGTLSLLSRAISTIFDRTGHRVCWVVHCLAPICSEQEKGTENQPVDPDFYQIVAVRLLHCASDPSLGIYVSDLYVRIAVKLSKEDSNSLSKWFDVLVRLCNDEFQKYSSLINQYLLPKLAVADANLVVQLLEHPIPVDQTMVLPLKLACYRVLLRPEASAKCRKQAEQITVQCQVIRPALTVCDLQLRMSAFELLLALIKGCSDPEKLLDYAELFLHFIKHNMWTYERPVRRQIVTGVGVISKRLWDTRSKLLTKTDCVDRFLTHLAALLLQSLHPGVPAPRMNFALSALYTLISALNDGNCVLGAQHPPIGLDILFRAMQFGEIPYPMSNGSGSDADQRLDRSSPEIDSLIARLYLGLYSPYEEDREYALQIMLTMNLASELNTTKRGSLWLQALTNFATTAKPDVSPLAWNMLRLTVNDRARLDSDLCPHGTLSPGPPTGSMLLDLTNPTERACLTIRYLIKSVEQSVQLAERNQIEGLLAVAAKTPFYATLSAIRAFFTQFDTITMDEKHSCNQLRDPKVQQKSASIIRFDRPLCSECIFRIPDHASTSCPSSIADDLISIALRISDLIIPILSHASPEGFVPDQEETESVEPLENLSNHAEQTRQYPEYLTICCWRSVRELSILLGCCLPRAGCMLPEIKKSPSTDLTHITPLGLTHDQLLRISEFFCVQLLCGRHSGAIEQCSAAFTPFCQALLSCEYAALKQLPVLWLDAVLNNLLEGVDVSLSAEASFIERARWLPLTCLTRQDKGYCVTRRSAGLPLFIQDILGAVWIVNGKDDTPTISTINRLLDVIEQTFKHCTALETSNRELSPEWNSSLQRCVVALNVARTLLRSSVLMQPTAQFIERATCLAIDGLGCAEWAIRNSSGLLFSTLIERLFGVNRSREATSRKNCLSSANFFKRYPNLKAHLVRTLEATTSDLNAPNLRRTRLYSSLLILTRLLPPTQQSAITGLVGSTFGPFVLKCAASCDIRIRQQAARALISLVQVNHLPKVAARYITQLHNSIRGRRKWTKSVSQSNLIHGLLLQLQQLLSVDNWITEDYSVADGACTRDALLEQLSTSLSCLADPRTNPCPVIRKTFLAILGTPGPWLDRWNAAYLNKPGLELEASEEYIRLYVSAWFSKIRTQFTVSNSEQSAAARSERIMAFVKQLHSPQCRALFFRQMLLELESDLPEFTVNMYRGENRGLPHSRDKHKADSEFLRFLTAQFDFAELLHFLRNLDPCRIEEIRYGTLVLFAMSNHAPCDPSLLGAVLDWADVLHTNVSESEQIVPVACLPPVLLLVVALLNRMATEDSISYVTHTATLLTQSVQLCTTSRLDVDNLSCALLHATAKLPVDFAVALYKISREPLIFLFETLLNHGQPTLQDAACEACQCFVTSSNSKITPAASTTTGPQLPYVIFSQMLAHLLENFDFDRQSLVYSVIIPLLRRISVSSSLSTVQKDIRVFTPGSENRLFDIMFTVDVIVTVLFDNDPRWKENIQSIWTKFKTETDRWWYKQVLDPIQGDLFEAMDRIKRELENRYLNFFQNTI